MRTDAKVGFAIAGVLLAVLAVWAIVGSKKPVTKKTSAVTFVDPAPPTATNTDPVTPGPTTPHTTDTAPPVDHTTTPPAGTATDGMSQPGPHIDPPIDPLPPHDTATPPTGRRGSHTAVKPPRHTDGEAEAHFTPVGGSRKYTIKAGQTLGSIAYEVYGSSRYWTAIQRENQDLSPNHLKVNTTINLPDISDVRPEPTVVVRPPVVEPADRLVSEDEPAVAGRTYRVKSGDSLYRIAKMQLGSGRKADVLYDLNRDRIGSDKSALKVGTVLRLPTTTAGPMVLSDAGR